jgi:hypothetical protein
LINNIISLGKVVRTISHLKPIQVAYQLKNRFSKPGVLTDYLPKKVIVGRSLKFSALPSLAPVLKVNGGQYAFSFLNQEKVFSNQLDWGEEGYGKLWNYNLQYVDFVRQQDIPEKTKLKLLYDLYEKLEKGKLKLEPYPVSLRVMNIIRFLHKQQESDTKLQQWIYAEINYLSQNLEYHLLGNHLLENGFAILTAGYYFDQPHWIQIAEKLLKAELEEQILQDGAHFELSPMYHQIILFRVLEALDYLPKESPLYSLLLEKAKKMLAWMQAMTFNNGDIPHFNDSADGIAFTSEALIDYAKKLDLNPETNYELGVSGYRVFRFLDYECAIDVAAIGPSYQPGHGHADALSFILYMQGRPLLVEAGTSTYNAGQQRQAERSTRSHNSVEVNRQSQSEVYGAFRVGKRAKVDIHEDGATVLAASHDGYKSQFGIVHQRKFRFEAARLIINDTLSGNKAAQVVASFHIHPDVSVNVQDDRIILDGDTVIRFDGARKVTQETYQYAVGFNHTLSATVLRVSFATQLQTTIDFTL